MGLSPELLTLAAQPISFGARDYQKCGDRKKYPTHPPPPKRGQYLAIGNRAQATDGRATTSEFEQVLPIGGS
jgi:hypothetical protein